MKPQATRTTQKQLAYLSYWQSRGFTFSRDEKAPENTVTPPSFATRHPILDAILGSLTLAAFFGGMLALAIHQGAQL